MSKYIVVVDCSTTSCKSLLINREGKIVGKKIKNISQFFPESSFSEQDASEILKYQIETLKELQKEFNFKAKDVASIAITNQRETIVAWDVKSKKPIYNAIVWQDRRGAELCEVLIRNNHEENIKQRTGLIVNPYFSATKMQWLIQNNKDVQKKLKNHTLFMGTIDSWLIWNLTEGKSFFTDITNASRTMLFNIHSLSWDEELLSLFKIPKDILPEVKNNDDLFGYVQSQTIFDTKETVDIPIFGVIGDQSSALFGSKCFGMYDTKNTYGTGCFLMVNTGKTPIFSQHNLLTTVAWKICGFDTIYALEGSIFNAGSVFDWLINNLQVVKDHQEIESICNRLSSSDNDNHVHFISALSGLGAPYWNYHARGSIHGIELFTNKDDIIKAAVDSIAFQTNDLLSCINKDVNKKIDTMCVDGRLSNFEYLMKFQSGISHIKIRKPLYSNLTSLGAFYLSGLGVGWWSSLEEISALNTQEKIYEIQFGAEKVDNLTNKWHKKIKKYCCNCQNK